MRTAPVLFAGILASGTLAAQQLIVYDPAPIGTGQNQLIQLPTAMTPSPVQLPATAIFPVVGRPPVSDAMAGDLTFDSSTSTIWYTDGLALASAPTPGFSPGRALTSFFVPLNPNLVQFGALYTGLAFDSAANILYVANKFGTINGVTPNHNAPNVLPTFTPAFAMGDLTGLDWDPITGTLLACDSQGIVYPMFPGGASAGPAYPPPNLRMAAQGVAIDKTGLLNPLGVRSIWVIGGGLAVDVTGGYPPIVTGANVPTGVAFLQQAASNQIASCACGTMIPVHRINSPMVAGNPQFEIDITGVIPGSPVLMAVDFAFDPAFPLINTVGCGLGVLGTTSMMTNLTFASTGGNAVWPLSLALLPPGIGPAYSQALYRCPADPTGFALTNTLSLVVCAR